MQQHDDRMARLDGMIANAVIAGLDDRERRYAMEADLSTAVARLTIFTARRDAMREAARRHDYESDEPRPPLVFHMSEQDADAIDVLLAALAEAQAAQAVIVRAFVERVCARAEADMLAGSPLEGAHYRAMQEELRLMEQHVDGETQP